MTTHNNGGPAFPLADSCREYVNSNRSDANGMHLRDYFAAKAMHALIVEPPWSDGGIATVHSWSKGFKGSEPCDRFAFVAYAMADAMLKARETA